MARHNDIQFMLFYMALTFLVSLAVMDLNYQQLQFVADHLTDIKCLELMEALNETKFQLDDNELMSKLTTQARTTVVGEVKEPSIPCVSRLATWSQGAGKVQTFDILVLRLKEIGMPKLSAKVSRLVMHETSDELHRFFLDDPFKGMVPTKSAIVGDQDDNNNNDDNNNKAVEDVTPPEVTTADDSSFRTVVVAAIVCAFLLLSLTCCVVYAATCHHVVHRACPYWVALLYDVISDGLVSAWNGSKRSIGKYMLLTPKGNVGGLSI